jgi:DNA-binding MarR family transcriptional regulator
MSGERTVGELAELLSRRNSSVGETLRKLKEADLVVFRPHEENKRTGRGNPSGWWSLTDSGRVLVAQAPGPSDPSEPLSGLSAGEADHAASLEMEPEDSNDEEGRAGPWNVRPYQAFVRATLVSREVPALLDVLAHGEQAVESSFVARMDGDAHDYVFIFDPQLGARPAEALVAALGAADLPCTTGVVGDVRGLDAMVRDARAAVAAAQAVRRRRG